LDFRDLLRQEAVDVLSICSPTALHHDMVLEAVRAGVKAIFCEKPLAATIEEGVEMVGVCEAAGVVLAVNHSRRWDPVYVTVREALDRGEIGKLESIVGCYPGHVHTMGTHLFDLMRWYAGDAEWVCGDFTGACDGRSEPGVSGFAHFQEGAHGSIVCGRDRRNHIFELDLLGSAGRISIRADGSELQFARYAESPRYSGYRELQPAPAEGRPSRNRLIAAIEDILHCLEHGAAPSCSGRDGLAALEMACALIESASGAGRGRIYLTETGAKRTGATCVTH
jgi:predicted dehydrogenase